MFNDSFLKFFICFCFIIVYTNSIAQNSFKNKALISSYEAYNQLPREIAYAHLNKSTYIKGESLGFTAYVLDKTDKQLSTLTTNLYCVISDKNEKIIKKKLVRVENGISSGLFIIDSLFTSGVYKFKAYTNWMQNFNEKNFFVQTIRIIDPDIELFVKPEIIKIKIDAKFLPEGGHLVDNVKNTVGVVIKDTLGFGIPFIKGQLLEDQNKIITTFKVSELGIGRFSFIPDMNKKYKVKFNYLDKDYIYDIEKINSKGIAISLNKTANNVAIAIKTNEKTLPLLNQDIYKLIIHNGQELNSTEVVFNNNLEVIKLFDSNKLFPGINIFTLFDQDNIPILERLFFNYEGVEFIKSDSLSLTKESDSLLIKLTYINIDSTKVNNLSVSILPNDTKSYKHHHNLPSYTLLAPYIKGFVENPKYYFTQINRKKKYELDNLLLTQGWSSYNWTKIFNNAPSSYYAFENGIGFIANVVKPQLNKFVLYPIGDNGLEYFTLSANEKSFGKGGLFPNENNMIRISEIVSNGALKTPILSLQFFPEKIPTFNLDYELLNIKYQNILSGIQSKSLLSSTQEKNQELDEIVVTSSLEQTRIEKIKMKTPFGKVNVLNDIKRGTHQTLANYLRQHGYTVRDHRGEFIISTIDPRTLGDNGPVFVPPTIYVDGAEIFDLGTVSDYKMDWVDYVEINKNGIGEGIRGGGGVIKIFTLPVARRKINNKVKSLNEYKLPLTFSASKKFYVPIYQNYKNQFFRNYGVIDWFPINKINKNGTVTFKIFKSNFSNIVLLIEGIANDGSFISEVVNVETEN